MRLRSGFVSNSSASSFVVPLSALTDEQVAAILDHFDHARIHFPTTFGFEPPEDGQQWRMECEDDYAPVYWRVVGLDPSEEAYWFEGCVRFPGLDSAWAVARDDEAGWLIGHTGCQNFDMGDFLDAIGVPREAVEWCGDESHQTYWEVYHREGEIRLRQQQQQ